MNVKAVISARGTYNGAPCFEYEIQDEGGNVLAFDFVHGRGIDEAFVLGVFLPKRLAKWALSATARRESRVGGIRLRATTSGEVADESRQSGVSITERAAKLMQAEGRFRV